MPFHTIINSLNDPSKEIIQNKTQAIIKSKRTETLIEITKPEFVTDDNRVVSRIRSYRPSGISPELSVLDLFLRCLTPNLCLVLA